jgi:hypothetical protein
MMLISLLVVVAVVVVVDVVVCVANINDISRHPDLTSSSSFLLLLCILVFILCVSGST